MTMTPYCSATELLLCCARTHIDAATAGRIRELLAAPIDWPVLIRMADHHGVMPLLCRSLSSVCPEAVPRAVLGPLQDRFRGNAQRNLFLTRQLIELLERLEAEGVSALPFKGPMLAVGVYGDLSLRQINDLDILVRERDVARAREALAAAGYRQETLPSGIRVAAYLRTRHHDLFWPDQGGVAVELHWRFAPAHLSFPLDLERLWERLERAPLAHTSVRSLAPEDLLLILCVHGFSHGWTQLNWICDVAELVRTHPRLDWRRAMTQARALGSERKLLLGLRLAADLLEASLPDEIRERLQADTAVRSLVATVRERLFAGADESSQVMDSFFLRLRAMERLPDRVRYALYFTYRRMVPDEADEAPRPLSAPRGVPSGGVRPFRLAGQYRRLLFKCFGSLVQR
jgi:hypothetical protein